MMVGRVCPQRAANDQHVLKLGGGRGALRTDARYRGYAPDSFLELVTSNLHPATR